MSWRLAKSLEVLRNQINALAPQRSKKSDGAIGDTAHASRKSDHNPRNGVVHAIDITHDPEHGCNAAAIATALLQHRDPRIANVIWNRRIFSSTVRPWKWRQYTGSNPHNHHVHVSVKDSLADDVSPWNLSTGETS